MHAKKKLMTRDGDGYGDVRRPTEEKLLGATTTTEQLARSIMFRFRRAHVPRLVDVGGRMHFQLVCAPPTQSTQSTASSVTSDGGVFAEVVAKLNAWCIGSTVCSTILDSPPSLDSEPDDVVMDIELEVRTSGVLAQEWDI